MAIEYLRDETPEKLIDSTRLSEVSCFATIKARKFMAAIVQSVRTLDCG